MKTTDLLLLPLLMFCVSSLAAAAQIEGGLVAPGSKDLLSLQPCAPHLGIITIPMAVANSFDYEVTIHHPGAFTLSPTLTVEEYLFLLMRGTGGGYQCTHGDSAGLVIECYEYTPIGFNARNYAYDQLISDNPSWAPYLYKGEKDGQFYSIDVDYELIAILSHFNDGFFHSEACYASTFTGYNGCHTVASSQGQPGIFDRRDNAEFLWRGQAGFHGPNKRAAINAIDDCPRLAFTQGDGRITLAPIVRETSHEPFTPVPPSFTFEVGFNTAMNTGMNPLHYVEFHPDPGVFSVDNAYWWDDYTMRVGVSSSGEVGNRCGLFGINTALAAAGNPRATLDGDMIAPNNDHYYFYMGQDCTAGNSNLKGYCADTEIFSWSVDGEDGRTVRWAVEGWTGEEWVEDASVLPGEGDMAVQLSQPYEEARLLSYDIDTPLPTYHGGMVRGHLEVPYRPFSGDRDHLMERAWERLSNPAPGSTGRGRHPFRERTAIALVTAYLDEHYPLITYLESYCNVDVHVVEAAAWPIGQERRQGIKDELLSLYQTENIVACVLVGGTNDWEVWSEPWPDETGWDVIQQNYWQTRPPGGNPERDDIPMGEYIPDAYERRYNTSFWTPYVPSMDFYADMNGDGLPDIDLGFIPVLDDAAAASVVYKAMTYMDYNGFWDNPWVTSAVFVGDEDYDDPGDGLNSLLNAQQLSGQMEMHGIHSSWLRQSDGHSYWRTQQFINMMRSNLTMSVFTGPNSSKNNLVSITWAAIFNWSDVGTCWPGVTFGAACGLGNVGMTRRHDRPHVLLEDALAETDGGQIMGVVSLSGTLDKDLMYFYERLFDRLFDNREVPLATHVRMAKRDCADAGRYTKTVQSVVLMGYPWMRMNNYTYVVDTPMEQEEWRLVFDNSPNPFTDVTDIRFTSAGDGIATVRILDVTGRVVRDWDVEGVLGMNMIQWDGRNQAGQLLPSGVYFGILQADGEKHMNKMLRVR